MGTLNPFRYRTINRILPFGFIWFFTGSVFMLSDYFATGNKALERGAITLNIETFAFASSAVFIVGLVVGYLETAVVDPRLRNKSFIATIVWKFLIYNVFFVLMMAVLYPIAAALEMNVSLWDIQVKQRFAEFWQSNALYGTSIQLVFSLLVTVLYAEIRDNLGAAVLYNFFTGKYHKPITEERIFMFVDMKASTTIAEQLGHVRYFTFLQRYYNDMADAIIAHWGEVYQYIGDEVVISWPINKGIRNTDCIACFYSLQRAIQRQAPKYNEQFGVVPQFKAGMHMGKVTTGELGALKKELVFTGDVLNTAARIQSLCNEMKTELLISDQLKQALQPNQKYKFNAKGTIALRGKEETIALYAVEEQNKE
ncbi:adenylate/guanylate cyclase domain-containing protein [Croceivirga sp. JEA036]|uniref:adenylate/guanylate cyclase domain-containing protein n=1 Tax=Croceivirga sp. JEA036 TaxID=2721162 RepID=UPI00143CAD89|nr:adenylate/guanylate cyclase domain-containing protein [Croceivirga sp. JEA036]NJB35648.1 adenylate/guanylate cyclase domain-containing protein [Croceivirga sp. JEA036]